MRLILIFVFGLFISMAANAQTEVPLTSNPVLIEKNYEQELNYTAHRLRVETAPQLLTERGGKYKDTLYVVTGKTVGVKLVKNILDTVYAFGAKKGTTKVKGDSVLYIAPLGVKKIAFDTFGVVRCVNKTKCDTTIFVIVIKRAGKLFDAASASIKAEEKIDLCGKGLLQLPGKWRSALVVRCDSNQIAKYVNKKSAYLDTCIRYEASRFAGSDTICLVVCDEYRVCDTLRFVVNVSQKIMNVNESALFMDDFAYEGPYPNKKLWLDDRVFVNNAMAPRAPSSGMATFDGINEKGKPYKGGFGVADVLTSTYLDLEGVGTNLWLTFYVTPKGYGFPPKDADKFVVELRDKNGQWKQFMEMAGPGGQSTDPTYRFFFRSVAVPNVDGYRYKGFQFRFKAFGSRNGMTSIWNLDYVRMTNKSPIAVPPVIAGATTPSRDSIAIFEDIALTESPRSFLKKYTAMPWWQFKNNSATEINDSIRFGLLNHFAAAEKMDDCFARITELSSGTKILDNYSLNAATNYPSHLFYSSKSTNKLYTDAISTKLAGVPINDKVTFLTEYIAKINNQDQQYAATRRNDTLRTRTVLDDYFAYDDGSAESGWTAQGAGSEVAVKFRANVADKVQGVRMYIPRFETDQTNQKMILKVWVNTGTDDITALAKKPNYSAEIAPFYLDKVRDSLYGFSSYAFTDSTGKPSPLNVPAGKDFYIGWEQTTSNNGPIAIGYDKNTRQGRENLFFRSVNTTWQKGPASFTGALMIRPVMGEKTVTNSSSLTATKEAILDDLMNVYPNPTQDILYLDLKNNLEIEQYQVSLYNQVGQLMLDQPLSASISIGQYNNGIYILKIQDKLNKKAFYKKVMKAN